LGVGEELDSAGAFPAPTAGVACSVEDVPESRTGDPSGEETISLTKGEPVWRCWFFCECFERLTRRIFESVWVELIFVERRGKRILTA